MSDLEYIRERVPEGEQLAQLAEEAMELGQAALKLRRVLDGTNPTPVCLDAALASFREELADVQLCLRVLGYEKPLVAVENIIRAKTERWASRLKDKERTEAV
jgi:NTP pyrophosphatase (non-canonical NTP hydrolase)